MINLGSMLGADTLSPTLSPSGIDGINSITVGNAYINDLYITLDTSYVLGTTLPDSWDANTQFYAKYDNHLSAGNVDFDLSDVLGSYILIKRKIKGTINAWITLEAFPIASSQDLNKLNFTDYTAAPKVEYEYALVPIINGTEGDYYSSTITPDTEMLVIVDSTALWATIITDGFANSQRNSAPGVIEPLNSKYPVIVHNGMANYDTVSITAGWFPTEEDHCTLQIGPEYDGWVAKYAKRFMDFLTNKRVKMLKNVDGRMWLCYVTTLPANNARDVYWDREITFGVTEVGDVEDERVLYDAGLINAPERWWNSQ
ncbi:MAG: hypothetical protein IJ880_06020 [Bacilli bacterium]|nr:hypothetical protein [Bacilli bacterium]